MIDSDEQAFQFALTALVKRAGGRVEIEEEEAAEAGFISWKIEGTKMVVEAWSDSDQKKVALN